MQPLSIKEVHNLENQSQNIDAKLLAVIERLSTLHKSSFQQISKNNGITPLQLQVLLFVSEHKKDICNVSYIAQELLVTKATISDSVKTLVEKNLIEKKSSPTDSRISYLSLSREGKIFYNKIKKQSLSMSEHLDSINDVDKSTMLHHLLDILNICYEKGDIPLRACKNCGHYEALEEGFHCHLMKKNLPNKDLRLDCPEHQDPKK